MAHKQSAISFGWDEETAEKNGQGPRVEAWKGRVIFPKGQDEKIVETAGTGELGRVNVGWRLLCTHFFK